MLSIMLCNYLGGLKITNDEPGSGNLSFWLMDINERDLNEYFCFDEFKTNDQKVFKKVHPQKITFNFENLNYMVNWKN